MQPKRWLGGTCLSSNSKMTHHTSNSHGQRKRIKSRSCLTFRTLDCRILTNQLLPPSNNAPTKMMNQLANFKCKIKSIPPSRDRIRRRRSLQVKRQSNQGRMPGNNNYNQKYQKNPLQSNGHKPKNRFHNSHKLKNRNKSKAVSQKMLATSEIHSKTARQPQAKEKASNRQ